jgi:CheY-like chemotaxis protein
MGIGIWAGSDEERAGPERHQAAETTTDEQLRPYVLVIDDDESILATIREILVAEGYDVAAASSGAEAIALLGAARPALVLLDMRMPGVNGWMVARSMRELVPGVPIVVMTAAENAARWAAEISAAAYLPKPFQLDDLLLCVARFLGHARTN